MESNEFWENFDEPEEEEEIKKIHTCIIWHEIGHLVGHKLSEFLGFQFGEIIEGRFINDDENPYVKHNCMFYTIRRKKENELRKVINNLKQTRKLLSYFIYILSGAVLNILYLKKDATIKDFEDCFINEEPKDEELIRGRAGADFSWIENLKNDLSWGNQYDFNQFKDYALEIFYIYERNGLRNILNKFACEFEKKHNGKLVSEEKIKKEIALLNEILMKEKELIEELKSLLDKYESKIVSL